MDSMAWLLSAGGFALAMSATPGPNNAMVAASAANFGLRRTLPHVLGTSLGFPLMLVLVGFGAAQLLAASPGLQAALRWVGAAWMVWLAWQIARAEPALPGAEFARPADDPGGGRAVPIGQPEGRSSPAAPSPASAIRPGWRRSSC